MTALQRRLSDSPSSAKILHLDNHLLVVSKPAGQLVQGDRTGDVDLLTDAKEFIRIEFAKPGNVFVGLVHRLDRPASGVVVLARTSKAAERLSKQFRERTVTKRYLALVEGRLRGAGKCEGYIAKMNERPELVSARTPGAKHATLLWRALELNDQRSVVEVDLETGRPHQIRLQLAELGHPIVGDLRYGAVTEYDGKNLALHSVRLDLEHPTTRERLRFVDLPDKWSASELKMASKLIDLEVNK